MGGRYITEVLAAMLATALPTGVIVLPPLFWTSFSISSSVPKCRHWVMQCFTQLGFSPLLTRCMHILMVY